MKRLAVAYEVVIVCCLMTAPLACKEATGEDYPRYVDPEYGWVFGLTGSQFYFDEARRFVEVMRILGARAAIELFGGELGLEGVPRGLLYHQIYEERGQYLACYINTNGRTLILTRHVQVVLSLGDKEIASKACFLFDDERLQNWLWDSRRGPRLVVSKNTIEKLEHSPWGWVMVVAMFDPVIKKVSDIEEVRVTGIKVSKTAP